MTVIVKRGRVDTGEKEYFPGDSISGLSEKDEQDLVASGVCRYPDTIADAADLPKNTTPPVDDLPEDIKKLPGGYYELPNGEKVRGKNKALEAYQALKDAEALKALEALKQVADDLPEGLIDLGDGLYELPNGDQVEGKEAAIEALEALNDESGGGPNTNIPE